VHMTRYHFSFKEAFLFGWEKTVQHYWFSFLTFLLITLLITSIDHVPLLRTIVVLLAALSVVSVSLLIARNHHFTFESLFTPLLSPVKVAKFLILSVVYAIPIILTVVFLYFVPANFLSFLVVIPCIYIAVKFKFFPYVVIENENASLQNLLKMTLKITDKHFFMVLGFILLVCLLNLAITVPMSLFATAHVYTKLKDHTV
jgi:hypothetical protein